MGFCGNCTAWQAGGSVPMYQADPDIAGIGIISVYIATGFITICLSAAHLVFTNSGSPATNPVDCPVYKAAKAVGFFKIADSKKEFWIPLIKKVVLCLSDQQLLTGLAILIAGFWTHCSISVYHFALVNDLAWFSAGVHLTTLTVLQDYFLARPILRNWRVALMLTMAQLLIASTVMQGHYEWYDSWPHDAQCLFDDLNGNIGGQPRYWMSVGLTLICFNYTLSIIPLFEWPTRHLYLLFYTKPRAAKDQAIKKLKEKLSNHISPTSFKGSMKRFGYILLILFLSTISGMYFALLALIGSNTCYLVLDIFWFAFGLWGIIGDRNIPPSLMDGDENAMSFGQIVPILLLSSIVLVFLEAYDGLQSRIKRVSQLTRQSEQREMEKEEEETGEGHSRSTSSQRSLVHGRTSPAASRTTSQHFEMTGATPNGEDDAESEGVYRPRRADTEMGGRSQAGRSQASGLESGPSIREPQRRPTLPPPAPHAQLGSGQGEHP